MGCSITQSKCRWKSGIVPYSINNQDFPFRSNERQKILNAIDHWNKNTSLRFIPRFKETDCVIFQRGDQCASPVGRQGGEQAISCNLLKGSFDTGSIIHEIGHAVGLWHEHTREDREEFVSIKWSNIQSDKKSNFNRHINDGTDIGSYDYKSIMHYSKRAFAIDKSINTITPKSRVDIGLRDGLSNLDLSTINTLYNRKSEFYTSNGDGSITRLDRFNGKWNDNWYIILSGQFGRNSFFDLMFYDKKRGVGKFYTTNGSGGIRSLAITRGWRTSWDMIIPGHFGGSGHTDLLFYDKKQGEAEFYISKGNGEIKRVGNKIKGWRKSWDMIIPGHFGGSGYTG